jgi:nucleotide-binding universal stress UspA family protein
MPYTTVMVHIDAEGDSSNRVNIAVDLARRSHAALIGIGGWSPGMGFATDIAVIDGEPVQWQRRELMTLMAGAEERFQAAARGLENVEWRGELCLPLDHLIHEARSADVVVIGREAVEEKHCVAIDPSVAVLRMGRPVLTVPNGITELRARRVVIGWKDVREARRAVRDALPMLQDAEEVMLVQVSETAVKDEAIRGLDDVADYLAPHQVGVTAKVYLRCKTTIASELLAFAQKEKSDLLVAGAYGHSRLGEWMFGGVTRELLDHSPICCLLAH